MTFVRIGQFNALPGTTDALRRIYETEAIPVIRQAAGNISALLLQEHQSPESFMAITIWKTQDDAMPDDSGDYTTLLVNGQPIGGIMPMPKDIPASAPSHWLVYFASADVDATAAKVAKGGGKIMVPPMDIPGTGRFAVFADPQGAVFAVIRFRM